MAENFDVFAALLRFSGLFPSKIKQLRERGGRRKCVWWGRSSRERKECFPLNI